MTNKEYRNARDIAEQADELTTFERWNGYSFYPSRNMTSDDIHDMRAERKRERAAGAFALDGYGVRAVVKPEPDGGLVLTSYYTAVAAWRHGRVVRLWGGFSVTTLKHVNAFCDYVGAPRFTKRAWIEAPTE